MTILFTNLWLGGFFGNTGANSSYSQYNLVIIPEEDKFNNTLSSTSACTNGTSVGHVYLMIKIEMPLN